jgi:hypothetical protein
VVNVSDDRDIADIGIQDFSLFLSGQGSGGRLDFHFIRKRNLALAARAVV